MRARIRPCTDLYNVKTFRVKRCEKLGTIKLCETNISPLGEYLTRPKQNVEISQRIFQQQFFLRFVVNLVLSRCMIHDEQQMHSRSMVGRGEKDESFFEFSRVTRERSTAIVLM